MEPDEVQVADLFVDTFRLKKLIERLQKTNLSGAALTLVIPPSKSIKQICDLLTSECANTASIKSRFNRNRVVDIYMTAKERLKHYETTPKNGFMLFCGYTSGGNNVENKFIVDISPPEPTQITIFDLGQNFRLEQIKNEMLNNHPSFGFIVEDRTQLTIGLVHRNTIQILEKIVISLLPKRSNKGGASSVRFARLREQRKHNVIRFISEKTSNHFLKQNKCFLKGLVIGSNQLFLQLSNSGWLNPILEDKVIGVYLISSQNQSAVEETLNLARQTMYSLVNDKEIRLIQSFFDEINRHTGMVSYGIKETMTLLQKGLVRTVICSESLDCYRVPVKPKQARGRNTFYFCSAELKDSVCQMHGVEMIGASTEQELLSEWLASHHTDFNADLIFVSETTKEGKQFLKGFSGLGAFLRYEHKGEEQQEWTGDTDNEYL